MEHHAGDPTTGLLSAVGFLKDNRILPRGFAKDAAPDEVAVIGDARVDADFLGGSDQVRFELDVVDAFGPLRVSCALWYQPIAYRWALNLEPYDAPEPERFLRYYREMADVSALRLAEAAVSVP